MAVVAKKRVYRARRAPGRVPRRVPRRTTPTKKTLPRLVSKETHEHIAMLEARIQHTNNLLYAILVINIALFGFMMGALIKYFLG